MERNGDSKLIQGAKADPGNYRAITLLSTIGKPFCIKLYNGKDDGEGRNSKRRKTGFRPNRGCVDRVYTLGEIVQGRKDAG